MHPVDDKEGTKYLYSDIKELGKSQRVRIRWQWRDGAIAWGAS